jgi:integrase
MSNHTSKIPGYRLKKVGDRRYAVVTLPDGRGGRREISLGQYGSQESKVEYARIIAEWETSGRRLPPKVAPCDLTLNEVMIRFWEHAQEHYRLPDGTHTNELNDYRLSLRPIKELYGHLAAKDFSPLKLKTVRQKMIEANLCRGVINQRIGRIVRMFKWAVSEELVSGSVHYELAQVPGLARGRTKARETDPVKPVPYAFVDAVLPHVLPPVRAMIELQRLTGMRPGEACVIRAADIDMTGDIWLYRPQHHKTAHRGKARVIAIGPRAQEIIKPFFTLNVEDYLFSPRRAMEQRRIERRAKRRSKVQPSQLDRRGKKPKQYADRYRRIAYTLAISRGCIAAKVPHWHPNQLRHSHGTEVRRRFGLEAAQVALGHSQANVTQVYAERDLGLAVTVAQAIG